MDSEELDDEGSGIHPDDVRAQFSEVIGQRVIDVSFDDPSDWAKEGRGYICLLFENGAMLKVFQHPPAEGGVFESFQIDTSG